MTPEEITFQNHLLAAAQGNIEAYQPFTAQTNSQFYPTQGWGGINQAAGTTTPGASTPLTGHPQQPQGGQNSFLPSFLQGGAGPSLGQPGANTTFGGALSSLLGLGGTGGTGLGSALPSPTAPAAPPTQQPGGAPQGLPGYTYPTTPSPFFNQPAPGAPLPQPNQYH